MIVLCSACRWWNKPREIDNGFGTCNLALSFEGVPEYPESLAQAEGDDGFVAMLKTKADFGCVQGETD